MDADRSGLLILTLIVLVLCSAFFSAAETAFSSLNRVRRRLMAEDGNAKAKKALALVEQYDRLLTTILIGNNVVNIAAASIATILFTRLLGDNGPAVSTLVLTLVVLIFGEITPKSMAKEYPESFACAVAPVLRALTVICTPLNAAFSGWKKLIHHFLKQPDSAAMTEDELIGLVEEAEDDGILDENESDLIRSAIEFDDVEVEAILTHRVDLRAAADTDTADHLMEIFVDSGYSRIPIYHETIDNIIGVVLEKDFYQSYIQGRREIAPLIKPIEYTTESTKISALLSKLQTRQSHMAVVIDEYGGTQGIVTMEDILEELVGEIWDEHDDVENDCIRQGDGTWLISGAMSMDDFTDRFDIRLESDSTTVGGWVLSMIGNLPHEGYTLQKDGLDISIARVTKRRILQVRIAGLKEKE